jgi:hypothetical protein
LRDYQPGSNLVKDENDDLHADSNNIVNRWKSHFSLLLNVHNVSDVRQIEIHSAEPLVPGHTHLEVEIAIAKLKKYKSPSSDQILAELIQAGGETLVSVSDKLINSRMVSSGMLHRVALVRTDVSEELNSSFIRVTRIGELGKTLAVTSNRLML